MKKYAQSCDSFHGMGQLSKLDEMPLQPQLVVEPFDRWALNYVGPIKSPSKQKNYSRFCTYYMTKWVEARALVRDNDQALVESLFE